MLFGKNKKAINREVEIQPLSAYKTILLVGFTNDSHVKNITKSCFTNANVLSFNIRQKKQEETSDFDYTFHKSDLRFGKIKNDKLNELINQKFDLIIFSNETNPNLTKIANQIDCKLIAGPSEADINYIFDLLSDESKNPELLIKNITHQIKLLKND